MAAKGNVDLIIRAKNDATRNLDQINKALKALSDQQAIVGDSAARADDKLGQLGLELARLRANAQNLQSLAGISAVMDKATAALLRQQQAADTTSTKLNDLKQKQSDLGTQSKQAAKGVTEATAELLRQQGALDSAKLAMSGMAKDTAALTAEEKKLQGSADRTAATVARRTEALAQAETKQRTLTEAMAAGERVTKTQQTSLEAANRAIEKRRAALAESVAKEAELRQKLIETKAALDGQVAGALNLGGALAQQANKTTQAKDALAAAVQKSKDMAAAQRGLVTDIAAAALAAEREATALRAAQTEMAALVAASNAAKTAVNSTAQSTNAAAAAATKAAFTVATLAARLAALNGLGGRATTNPLGIDPAKVREAAGSIAQMGVTIRAAANENTRASVTAAELTAAMKGVGAAGSSLTAISQALASQRAAVTGAKEGWVAAQAEVKRLALAIKATAEPSNEMAAALGRAQGAARNAKDEFLRETTAANEMANALKQAGIGAGTLTSAEAALVPRIQAANGLLTAGAAAAARYAGDVRNAGDGAGSAEPKINRLAAALNSMANAAKGAASATNPLSRLKTELIGVAAASVGLYGLAGQLKSVWEAGTQLAATQIRFNVAFDGVEEGTAQLKYARQAALNLKLPLATTVKAYAELALSAKGGALEGENARKIFIGFAQAARVTGATSEATAGVFKALTQIISKGKVQAEELRQQLGDRLPGAMQLMATGLGVTTAQLDKMMKKGELTSETLVNMAATMSERMGPQLEAALKSPAARLQDFQNRMTMFKEEVAGSGFLDAVGDAFDKLAVALSSPEALEAARGLGQALGDIVTWATELATNGDLDAIWESIKTLGAVWAGLQIAGMITSFYAFATAIGVTTVATLGLDVAMAPILVGLGVLAGVVAAVAAAFGAWKLGEWAYENFPAFAEGVLSIKNSALEAWDGIVLGWDIAAAKLLSAFGGLTTKIAAKWYGLLNTLLSAAPDMTAKLGLGDYADDVAARAAAAGKGLIENEAELQEKLAAIKAKYANQEREREKDLQSDIAQYYSDRINAGLNEDERAAAKKQAADLAKGLGGPSKVAFPGQENVEPTKIGLEDIRTGKYEADTSAAKAKAAAAAAKKAGQERVSLEKSVADQMFGIREKLERKSAETIDEQVAAVAGKYTKLYGQLAALGKDKNSQEWKDVDALVAQEGVLIRQKAEKKEQAAADKAARAAEVDSMKSVEALYRTRKNLQEQLARAQLSGDQPTADELTIKIAEITAKADTATTSLLDFWRKAGESGESDAAIAKLEQLQLTLTKVQSTAVLTGQSISKALGSNAKSSMDGLIDSIGSGTPVLQSLGDAFIEFARTFLLNIAKMILQQMLLNAISSSFGNIAGTVGGALTSGAGGTSVAAGSSSAVVSKFHTGGIIGSPRGSSSRVDAGMFANAARHHTGGIIGLKASEVPIVAEKGEEMLTANDPRHVNNGGSAGASPINLKMVNMIDSASVVSEGLNTVEGEETVMNIIKANKTAIRSMLM